AHSEVGGGVLENLAAVLIGAQGVIADHIADDAVARVALHGGVVAGEVGAVGVVVLAVGLVNAAVLKHAGGVDHHRLAVQADQVVTQTDNAGAHGVQVLASGDAAAKD